jgi:hypothetical protein
LKWLGITTYENPQKKDVAGLFQVKIRFDDEVKRIKGKSNLGRAYLGNDEGLYRIQE